LFDDQTNEVEMEIKCPKCNGTGAIRYANGVEIVCECPAGAAAIVPHSGLPSNSSPPPPPPKAEPKTGLEKVHGWLDVVDGLLGTGGEEEDEEEEEYEYE
jgi:hypothetical protein